MKESGGDEGLPSASLSILAAAAPSAAASWALLRNTKDTGDDDAFEAERYGDDSKELSYRCLLSNIDCLDTLLDPTASTFRGLR